MKYLPIIPLLFLVACATPPKLVVRSAPPPTVEPVESVRYAEVVRAYYIGRGVDPDHPETMHEQHQVYRIESTARWNLHLGPQHTANLLNPPPDAAFVLPPTNDVVIAEINRQREATARVMEEAARLAQSYGEWQQVIDTMKNVARNSGLMNTRLTTTEQRVTEFAHALEKLTGSPAPATNDLPAPVPEPPSGPQP